MSRILCLLALAVATPAAQEWAARYGSGQGLPDIGRDIVVDALGSAYVGGQSNEGIYYCLCLLRYTAGGELAWARTYRHPGQSIILHDQAVTLAPDGAVVLAGAVSMGQDQAFWVVKYDTGGNRLWASEWKHTYDHYSVWPIDLAADGCGNLYVTGTAWAEGAKANIVISSFSSSGAHRWTRYYDGPTHSWDLSCAVAADGQGGVYVAGMTEDALLWDNLLMLKYDTTGALLWTYRFGENSGLSSEGKDVKVANNGDVYAVGSVRGDSLWSMVLRLRPTGDTAWIRKAEGDGAALTVTLTGDVYATGMGLDSTAIRTWAYGPDGQRLWSRDWHLPGGRGECGVSVEDGPDGCLCVAGRTAVDSLESDYVVLKYNRAGQLLWAARYDGPAGKSDRPAAVAVSDVGGIYVTGESESEDGYPDIVTLKYRATGPGVTEYPEGDRPMSRVTCTPSVMRTQCLIAVANLSDPRCIRVHDAAGKLVRTLLLPQGAIGRPAVTRWDAIDDVGRLVPNGVYFFSGDPTCASHTAKVVVRR